MISPYLRPIFKSHGGKFYLRHFVISHFPKDYPDMTYVETCFGAGSVLLNKVKSKREICNDLDKNIYNIVNSLKNNPKEFIEKVKKIPYVEESFKSAMVGTREGLDGAVNEMVVRRMSRGGLGKNFSWSNRSRGGIGGDENAWLTFIDQLPLICDRLSDVEVSNRHVLDLLKDDSEDRVYYLDPPYVPSLRTAKNTYNVEMAEGEHVSLAKELQKIKGKVILSGYFSNLYAKLYRDWRLVTKEVANHAGQSKQKQRRIECLWMNFT